MICPRRSRVDLFAGRYLDDATSAYPNVVLGFSAAERLGIDEVSDSRIWIGEQWFAVIGILEPVTLAPGLDRAAIIGQQAAIDFLDAAEEPGIIFIRTNSDAIDEVRRVVPGYRQPGQSRRGRSRPSQ